MTAGLTERLGDLADQAPTSLDASGLWSAGHRHHRRRLATVSVTVAAVVAALGVLGLGSWRSTQSEPAGPPSSAGAMTLPDRFYTPSPWLPSTSRPGRLVALLTHVTRQQLPWGTSTTDAVAGVAAGSQRYTYLDLPDRAPETDVALSPDGLHVGYFLTGSTTRAPYEAHPPTGVGILDVLTGSVQRHAIPSRYGLDTTQLVWGGSRYLHMYANRTTWHHARTFGSESLRIRYDVISGQELRMDRLGGCTGFQDFTITGGCGTSYRARDVHVIDPATGSITQRIHLSRSLQSGGAITVSRDAIVGNQNSGTPSGLLVGRIVGGRARLHAVPGSAEFAPPLVWADARHVVCFGDHGLVSVDVRSGAVRLLARTPGDLDVATEAMAHPIVVPAVAPPQPWDLRVVAELTVVTLLCGAAVIVGVRRRRVRR